MISNNNSERYYEIDEYVIKIRRETSFNKYSYLHCKIKKIGCSDEMKAYSKKISYIKLLRGITSKFLRYDFFNFTLH